MTLRIIIYIVSFIWITSEIALARLKHSTSSDVKADKFSIRILWSTIVISIVAGEFLSGNNFGIITANRYALAFAGLLLILAGLAIRWIAIFTLRKYFTVDVSVRSDHKIVTTGVFKYVRHPSYSGSLLSFLGLGVTTLNWVGGLIIFVPIVIAFIYRINIEEKVLMAFLGGQYKQYCAGTKRLIPKIY
jgi:protein-S-isoprenylcysteine O-methyltransferase Ste14